MDERHFKNPLDDYVAGSTGPMLDGGGHLPSKLQQHLHYDIQTHLTTLQQNPRVSGWDVVHDQAGVPVSGQDASIYTGIGGLVLLYFKLYSDLNDANYLRLATTGVEHCLAIHASTKKKKISTFLTGEVGSLALGAVIFRRAGDTSRSQECLDRLIHLVKYVDQPDVPDELLYGRCGYLYALLFVNKHMRGGDALADPVSCNVIERVCEAILDSGKRTSGKAGIPGCPLVWEWHNKLYLGAAHGIAGILHTLIAAKTPMVLSHLDSHIRPTVDCLLAQVFPSGNLASSVASSSGDRLVQWCHGAPGLIPLLLQMHSYYKESRYLSEAERASDCVWSRGLLLKGYGLCHGVSGNAYAFLTLYRSTGNEKHLYRALRFAEWCFGYASRPTTVPDRPLSLFEGLAGTVYFLTDLLSPKEARFPAWEL